MNRARTYARWSAPFAFAAVLAGAAAVGMPEWAKDIALDVSGVGSEPHGSATAHDLPVVLPAPSLADWPGASIGTHNKPGHTPTMALAYQYDTRIFAKPANKRRVSGFARRGTRLPVASRVDGPGCKKGTWYELVGGGVVCTADGFSVSSKPMQFDVRQPPPDTRSMLPFVYGQVRHRKALRYYRIPEFEEEQQATAALAAGESLPEVVAKHLDGDYFVAIDREERDGDRRFYRTVRGRYLRVDDVELRPETEMHGELLRGKVTLPLAFVFDGDAFAHRVPEVGMPKADDTQAVGVARKHARFPVTDTLEAADGSARWVVGPDGLAIARDRVRVARAVQRPADVAATARWIHVDLDEQTLVAYQGDKPVFATLVSSGREDGFATPRGLFRIWAKHISTTMRGEDPDDGVYDVEEVPWTLFYWEGYALHGAYWHNDFGKPRSHGCTNLAPADARWLFYWSRPGVPAGWHAVAHTTGTWVYLTRNASEGA